jgi:hypothetical protein
MVQNSGANWTYQDALTRTRTPGLFGGITQLSEARIHFQMQSSLRGRVGPPKATAGDT